MLFSNSGRGLVWLWSRKIYYPYFICSEGNASSGKIKIMLQKKYFKKVSLIASLLLLSNISSAAFMIEPSIGYRQETIKFTDLLLNQSQIKMNSPIFELKLGVATPTGISFDLAASRSSGKVNFEPALSESPEYTHTLGSVQVGVNAMEILKIYLGYILHDEFETQSTSSFSGYKLTGQGYQAGLMTFPFPHLGLGLQYNIHQFKEISGAAYTNGKDVKNYFEKIDAQDVSASLSVLF